MGRRPAEGVSQHVILHELKIAIDRRQFDEIGRLARMYPRSVLSSHVLHNLGPTRRQTLKRWLEDGTLAINGDLGASLIVLL